MKEISQIILDTELEYYKDQEVYVYISAPDDDDVMIGDLCAFDNIIDLQNHLVSVESSDDKHLVLHGILTDAEVLPEKLDKGCVFVIGRNPHDKPVCVLAHFEGDSTDELAEAIEEMIEQCGVGGVMIPDISDVFILYGYELSAKLAVDEDEIDDERLEVCNAYLELTKAIKKINTY